MSDLSATSDMPGEGRGVVDDKIVSAAVVLGA
jgi:hypothetical protein